MNREIKFRAFCKSENRMLSYEHLKEATKGMVDVANAMIEKRCIRVTKPSPYGLFLPLEDEDLEFMQFTGLHDKNGKEIYEGDIVEGTITSAWAKQKIKCKVIYERDRFICIEIDGWVHKVMFGKDITVIGNICENPELIKGE